jgi:hypothetical protein
MTNTQNAWTSRFNFLDVVTEHQIYFGMLGGL